MASLFQYKMSLEQMCPLVTILSGCGINNFAGQSAKSVCHNLVAMFDLFRLWLPEHAPPSCPGHAPCDSRYPPRRPALSVWPLSTCEPAPGSRANSIVDRPAARVVRENSTR